MRPTKRFKPERLFSLVPIVMGLSCFGGQLLLIREFLIIFYGNELSIGLVLGNWLLLEAAGSFIFGKISAKLRNPGLIYALICIGITILFPLSIFTVRIIKNILSIAVGEGVGVAIISISSFLVMASLALLLGAQFPLVCRLMQKYFPKKKLSESIGKNYFLEAAGFGLGGIIITFLLIPHINSLRIALVLGAMNLACAYFILLLEYKKISLKIKAVLLALLMLFAFGYKTDLLHKVSLKLQWRNLNIIDWENSVYGNIAVTKQAEQYVFYYDGLPFMTIPEPDIVFTEDLINFSLALADRPKDILFIGPALGGYISQALKFPLSTITYAELDPSIIKMARRYQTDLTTQELNDPRVKIHTIDGRRFLNKTGNKFDRIIINLPLPSTFQLNRFFTQEFFALCKTRLKENGAVCLSLPGSLSSLSEEIIELNKCILNSLLRVFKKTEVITGYYNLYLAKDASDFEADADKIYAHLKTNGVKSALFTQFYIKDRLRLENKRWFYENIRRHPVRLNRDLDPAGVLYGLRYWNAMFSDVHFKSLFRTITQLKTKEAFLILISLFAIFFSSLLFGLSKKSSASALLRRIIPSLIISSGLTGASLNLIVILGLQTLYGYVYAYIGILISSFMLGLTFGAMVATKNLSRFKNSVAALVKIDSAFVLFSLFFPFFILGANYLSGQNVSAPLIFILFCMNSAAAGFLVGFEFPLGNKIYLENNSKQNPSNILYALDMLGAFFGSVFISIALIPTVGIINTAFLIAGVKIIPFAMLALVWLLNKSSRI
ncbi:MAG: fused MFS/spermidine synthase [Candidatus Omnitrophota bacterium]